MSNKPHKKLQQTQPEDSHQFLPEWLVNVYNYCVMVTKSVSCCCVHGSRVYLNPVTRNTSIPALFHVMIQFIFKPTIEVDWLKAHSKQFGVMSLLWCIFKPNMHWLKAYNSANYMCSFLFKNGGMFTHTPNRVRSSWILNTCGYPWLCHYFQ